MAGKIDYRASLEIIRRTSGKLGFVIMKLFIDMYDILRNEFIFYD